MSRVIPGGLIGLVTPGSALRPWTGGRVRLSAPDGGQAVFTIRRTARAPRGSEPVPPPGPRSLWITRRLSSTQAVRLREAGWFFVSDEGIWLTVAGYSSDSRSDESNTGSGPTHPDWSPAFSRVVHAILAMPVEARLVQTGLARVAGVSQPHVSGVLTKLVASGLLDDRSHAPAADTWLALAQAWARARTWMPITTYWTGVTDLAEALCVVRAVLPQPWVVSGDVGADILAPWRRPEQLVVLARGGTLAETPLVQVTSEEPAQVVLHATTDQVALPEDATALSWRSQQLAVAQPLQVWWDVLRSPGTDAPEAAAHLIDTLTRQRAIR